MVVRRGYLQHPSPETTGNDEPGVERGVRGFRSLLVVLAVLSSTFLYALDNTVTANARPSMIETFGNRFDMLPWLSVSYLMGEVGMNPVVRL